MCYLFERQETRRHRIDPVRTLHMRNLQWPYEHLPHIQGKHFTEVQNISLESPYVACRHGTFQEGISTYKLPVFLLQLKPAPIPKHKTKQKHKKHKKRNRVCFQYISMVQLHGLIFPGYLLCLVVNPSHLSVCV